MVAAVVTGAGVAVVEVVMAAELVAVVLVVMVSVASMVAATPLMVNQAWESWQYRAASEMSHVRVTVATQTTCWCAILWSPCHLD